MNRVEIRRKQIQTLLCIPGLLIWLILGRMAGMEGIGYLAIAAIIYWLFVNLTSGSVPEALGRLLRSRNARLQYKNEKIIRRSVLIAQIVLGMTGAVLVFVLAGPMAGALFNVPYSILAVRILAPAILFRAVSAALIGTFQGSGNGFPAIVTAIMRQVLYLTFGLLLGRVFREYGEKVALLLLKGEMPAMYSAAGIALGVVLTELLCLIFAVIVRLVTRDTSPKDAEGMKKTESFRTAVMGFYQNVGFSVLISCMGMLSLIIGTILYLACENSQASEYGIYFGGYLILCSGPIFLLSAMTHNLCVRAVTAYRKEEKRMARELFGALVHYYVSAGAFAAVFLTILARPISRLVLINVPEAECLSGMLQRGACMLIPAAFVVLFLRVLTMLGKKFPVLLGVLMFFVASVTGSILCLPVGKLGIHGLIYASIPAFILAVLLSGSMVFHVYRMKADLLYWIAVPCIAALLCGLVWMLLDRYAAPHIGFGATILIALVVGSVLYWGVQIILKSYTKQELDWIPGGRILKYVKELFS